MAKDDKNSLSLFERLKDASADEYTDFLMASYGDQFNRKLFSDRETVKKNWTWKYGDNPVSIGAEPPVWIYRSKGRIVAQICIMPVKLKVNERLCRAGWCQDLIVLPELRNSGMGHFLTRYAMSELKDLLDILIVAGTNENSYAIFKNLGFTDLGFVDRSMALTAPVLRNFYRRSPRQTADISQLSEFDGRFDLLWKEVSPSFKCVVCRERENLQWRFKSQPYWDYTILAASSGGKLKGYAVLREGELNKRALKGIKTGIISDMIFAPGEKGVGEALLGASFDHFKNKVSLVRCDVLDPLYQRLLATFGFIRIKSSNRLLFKVLKGDMEPGDKMTLNSRPGWHISFSDSDMDLL